MTLRQASEVNGRVYGSLNRISIARHTILQRLLGQRVRAIDDNSTWDDPHEPFTMRTPIVGNDWKDVSGIDSFWVNGDLIVQYYKGYEKRIVRHFDVRFHLDDIRSIVGNQSPIQAPDDPGTETARAV